MEPCNALDASGPRRRHLAQWELATLALFTAACLTAALTRDPSPPFVPPPGATSDLDVYRRIVDGVRSGGSYYDVAHRELVAHGYPTRSVFNWRTPVYAWLCAALPDLACARILLIGLAAVATVMVCRDLLEDVPFLPACVGGVMFVGAAAWSCGGLTVLFTEVWAGVLITLSIAYHRRGRVAASVAAGVAALFMRELALPYVVVALGLAASEGRRREAAAWAAGLAGFALFMTFHAFQIQARLTPSDCGMPGGWVRFGGLRFVLATAQANVFLMSLPLWYTALFVPLAVAGLTAWRGPVGRRVGLTGLLYLGAFTVVGAPFNFYWGFIDAPLLALGLAHAPGALADLMATAYPALWERLNARSRAGAWS